MTDTIEWTDLQEAHEIIDIGTVLTAPETAMNTYMGADDPGQPGDTEIPEAVWEAGYEPPSPYVANTTRNLQFNQSHFIASPGAPDGTTTYVTTSDGYTWASMSQAINAMWPYNAADYSGLSGINAFYAGNLVTTPADGVVKVTANYKAQDMKFWANEGGAPSDDEMAVPLTRYFVTDQWGNEYIMHASGQDDPDAVAAAFDAAVLPAGWSKSVRTLTEDLILNPAEGSDGSYHYLVFRDSADNTYHQVSWSGGGSLAGQVEGMPIWGGQTSDILSGDADGARDDFIHAAGGADHVFAGNGSDTVWGDAGADMLSGGGGGDTLLGNEAADTIYGNAGADLLYGNQEADWLHGGQGDDTLFGGQQADLLLGGFGDDVLHGGRGDDTLSGGAGADRFVVADDSGADLVSDFDGGSGDRLEIASGINGSDLDDFTAVLAAASGGSDGAVIDLGGGNLLTLRGIAVSELRADWFVFA